MAGIYIHIPFCRKACIYCDFHFSTDLRYQEEMVDCILSELEMQSSFFQPGELINTIYFGGGTPSLLQPKSVEAIVSAIHRMFSVTGEPEISFECNPDDVEREYMQFLFRTGINRISLGIQSFDESTLRWMNRSHNAQSALQAIQTIREAGIGNISADLIFGVPMRSMEQLNRDIQTLLDLKIEHVSCYGLTVEERTQLHFMQQHKQFNTDENQQAMEYEFIIERLEEAGYLHYEISNFARSETSISRHNSSYWKYESYLGIGPSAHSFDGQHRYHNIRNNHQYIRAIRQGILPREKEELSPKEQFNERILIGIRTREGINLLDIRKLFGEQHREQLIQSSHDFIESGLLIRHKEQLKLSAKGKLMADYIAERLFR
jgi:oxygen-independent coproporphyrinogen III oxidase